MALDDEPEFERWQTMKGLIVAGGLVVIFLATNWPRDVAGGRICFDHRKVNLSQVLVPFGPKVLPMCSE